MYCNKCGREIASDISFCPNCGTPVIKPEPVNYQPGNTPLNSTNQNTANNFEPASPLLRKNNSMATASMILGIVSISIFFIGIISIPCSIIGLILGIISRKNALNFKPNKDKALAGIICSVIGLVSSVIFILFAIFLFQVIIETSDEFSEFIRNFQDDIPNRNYYQFDYEHFNF